LNKISWYLHSLYLKTEFGFYGKPWLAWFFALIWTGWPASAFLEGDAGGAIVLGPFRAAYYDRFTW